MSNTVTDRWEPTELDLLEALQHGFYTGSGYDSAALRNLTEKYTLDDLTPFLTSRGHWEP